jgi:uncharacterized protein YkuJ
VLLQAIRRLERMVENVRTNERYEADGNTGFGASDQA